MTRRFIYDPMTPDEFADALQHHGMKRDAFSRITGADANTVRRWHKGDLAIPPWVPVMLAAWQAPTAIGHARSEANRRLRLDNDFPERGEYPYARGTQTNDD